jgi:hypothetical protein
VVDKVASETKACQKIPQIRSFTDEHGTDNMKQGIETNYWHIKKTSYRLLKGSLDASKMILIENIWFSRVIKKSQGLLFEFPERKAHS